MMSLPDSTISNFRPLAPSTDGELREAIHSGLPPLIQFAGEAGYFAGGRACVVPFPAGPTFHQSRDDEADGFGAVLSSSFHAAEVTRG